VRDSHKPQPPQFAGTPEDEIKKADEEQKQQAEESRKAIASLPADQRAQLEASLTAMLTQMNTPEMRKVRLDTVIADRAERTAQYREAITNWTRDYPERPAPLIAKRLREFLAVSADIDFTATLTPRNGKLIFENADYEQKPAQWKMCYRAGKEATTAARAAAQAWLKELGG
jgi:outer membrane PBP1 activator LpoA protein